MEQVTLRAVTGREIGSRAARRLRRDGLVPGVVYGRDQEATAVAVESRELYAALHTEAGLNALINLDIGEKETVLTVAREVQRHPVRGEIVHLDFVKISLTEEIEAEVGIEYLGTPAGVEEGGVPEVVRNSVLISALPMAIPSHIELDVSGLGIGDSVSIEDLPEIEGVTYVDEPELTLVTVVIPRAVVEEEPEDLEGEELLEGEEAAEGEEAEEGDEESGDESGE